MTFLQLACSRVRQRPLKKDREDWKRAYQLIKTGIQLELLDCIRYDCRHCRYWVKNWIKLSSLKRKMKYYGAYFFHFNEALTTEQSFFVHKVENNVGLWYLDVSMLLHDPEHPYMRLSTKYLQIDRRVLPNGFCRNSPPFSSFIKKNA